MPKRIVTVTLTAAMVGLATLFAPPASADPEGECSQVWWYQKCYHRWDHTWWICNFNLDGQCRQADPWPAP